MSEVNQPAKPGLPNLIWIDLEMSGLDPDKCEILEIACIVTDSELKELGGDGIDLVIHQPDPVLDAMDDWCTRHHGQSGLTDAVKSSTISLRAAELRTLEYLKRCTNKGQSPLAGSSVSHDRRFIDKYMPDLSAWLHYRTVDVSTVKELVKRWVPGLDMLAKKNTHRALDDIRESVEELRYYREHAFRHTP
ncbi:MAG: oligoribonuclease [Myxococcaceae bacterium]|nr:oligoribonuclease [Myxococcaceae bacterium]